MLWADSECKRLFVLWGTKARATLCFSTASSSSAGDAAQASSAYFASLLRWCARESSLFVGKQAHHHLIKSGLEKNTFLGNLLLHMYCSCGALGDASTLFSHIDQRNEFTWRI
eukprot:c6823_g1_i1 orf=1-336(-)